MGKLANDMQALIVCVPRVATRQFRQIRMRCTAVQAKTWWNSAEAWGAAGAIAGWGMTGAAIYDASFAGPEIISLNMTGVMLVYSSLFARWAFIVQPQNLALCACHISNVIAQSNQMRRAIEFKLSNGEHEVVADLRNKACMFIAGTGILIAGGPRIQSKIVEAKMGPVSAAAGAAAGPFTTHFWAPMSKWLISGASFMDLVILLFHTQISVAISASALY